ncbi:hypothetical protein PRIPAC_83015 [Pristionchus pacificus]|uniref:Uncharacterized protein n=1 Tax=Pristionchus pacificus TaxID=54126 RepID=A0A2A6CN19_PRIPA|nr:hypothetical protein PRIPAC_83015 [Pristionchus pacificus]|eukprot:PDM79487.1 hypothetical protein PRIPAC_32066 [Pristionchus pacificus]
MAPWPFILVTGILVLLLRRIFEVFPTSSPMVSDNVQERITQELNFRHFKTMIRSKVHSEGTGRRGTVARLIKDPTEEILASNYR